MPLPGVSVSVLTRDLGYHGSYYLVYAQALGYDKLMI